MKTKGYSRKAAALAIGMICCTLTAFTASAQETSEEVTTGADGVQLYNVDVADDLLADTVAREAPERDVMETESAESDGADTADKQSVANNQIVKLAKKYLGAPYEAGGTDLSSGVDSPGFVKGIYALAGIELPADIHELASSGTRIPLAELSAGDVIFYSSADRNDKLFHAAIYDGNGQVIHASNMREGVKISDLDYRDISMAVRILE